MLSSTEKILSVIVLALTLAVGFSLIQYGSAMDEMAQLRSEQAEHVDMVNKEFKQRVKAVELENIGQGKENPVIDIFIRPIAVGQDLVKDRHEQVWIRALNGTQKPHTQDELNEYIENRVIR